MDPTTDPVTMEKIVSLCKRRGLIFQNSEIYGGLGSVWDYGPLGVELKRNVKDAWWRAMVQQRSDVVGLDSAILMHPRVWEASGHLESFTDPLVECRECNLRWRADALIDGRCPKCNGEVGEARMFNLMFKSFMGPVEDDAAIVYLRPETAQGIFVNFENVLNSHPEAPSLRYSADWEVIPQRDHAREFHLQDAGVRADGNGVFRDAGGS